MTTTTGTSNNTTTTQSVSTSMFFAGDTADGSDHNNFHSYTNARPLLRVLCLHDANSHALELQESLEPLGDRLAEQYGIDLVYVNSPLAVLTDDGPNHHAHHHPHHLHHHPLEPRRVWWHEAAAKGKDDDDDHDHENQNAENQEQQQPTSTRLRHPPRRHVGIDDESDDEDDDDEPENNTSSAHNHTSSFSSADASSSTSSPYIGLDASLLLLQQVWTTGPFWGLLGVGQGGTIASILALLPTTFPPPQFLIFVQADSLLLQQEEDEEKEEKTGQESQQQQQQDLQYHHQRLSYIPALHLGSTDRLVAQFGGQVYRKKQHQQQSTRSSSAKRGGGGRDEEAETKDDSSSSTIVITKADLNLMGRFLVAQKRALFEENDVECDDASSTKSISNGAQIVALQNALYVAELEAADLIAQEIARNPPAALMAVIRPSQISGVWQGDKRRQFGTEGGGAPCPSEFLLNREKRANNPNDHGPSRAHPSSSGTSHNTSENNESTATNGSTT